MHTVLCQPGRPPSCSHFPQAWAFLFPTDISPLSVQLSKPAPGAAPPKKRGGGQSLPLHLPSSRQSPFLPAVSSPGRAATPEARGRRKLRAGATLLAHSPPRPLGPPDSGAGAPRRNGGAIASAGLAGQRGGDKGGSWIWQLEGADRCCAAKRSKPSSPAPTTSILPKRKLDGVGAPWS